MRTAHKRGVLRFGQRPGRPAQEYYTETPDATGEVSTYLVLSQEFGGHDWDSARKDRDCCFDIGQKKHGIPLAHNVWPRGVTAEDPCPECKDKWGSDIELGQKGLEGKLSKINGEYHVEPLKHPEGRPKPYKLAYTRIFRSKGYGGIWPMIRAFERDKEVVVFDTRIYWPGKETLAINVRKRAEQPAINVRKRAQQPRSAAEMHYSSNSRTSMNSLDLSSGGPRKRAASPSDKEGGGCRPP